MSRPAEPQPLRIIACPKFLRLLGEFYRALADPPPLDATLIDPAAVPQPYQGLLVHTNDMTTTLERHHGERVLLRVLQRTVSDNVMLRHIVLEGARTGRPLEYGAIRIDLGALPPLARRQVLQCRLPLGRILRVCRIAHRSCPGGYFRIQSNALINQALGLDGPRWLFGRCNCLSDAAGHTIAEVVEILPELSGDT